MFEVKLISTYLEFFKHKSNPVAADPAAMVFLTAVLEYLCAELLELTGSELVYAEKDKTEPPTRIDGLRCYDCSHLKVAVQGDDELENVFLRGRFNYTTMRGPSELRSAIATHGDRVEADVIEKAKALLKELATERLRGWRMETGGVGRLRLAIETAEAEQVVEPSVVQEAKRVAKEVATQQLRDAMWPHDYRRLSWAVATAEFDNLVDASLIQEARALEVILGIKDKDQRSKTGGKSEAPNFKAPTHNSTNMGANSYERKYCEGQPVDARYRGMSVYYPGQVHKINHDGTYAILFDDGDRDDNVLEMHVRERICMSSELLPEDEESEEEEDDDDEEGEEGEYAYEGEEFEEEEGDSSDCDSGGSDGDYGY